MSEQSRSRTSSSSSCNSGGGSGGGEGDQVDSTNNINNNINKNITQNTKVSHGDSPQINFALWNTFRFFLQCVGAVFLYYLRNSLVLDWWNLLFIVFLTLCALPVFLQSVVLWLTNVHHLRLMWLRGTL